MATGQPLRGLVGQSMAARKKSRSDFLSAYLFGSPGAQVITATQHCVVHVFAWGAGGGGGDGAAGVSGSTGYKKFKLSAGQSIRLAIGAGAAGSPVRTAGGDTTVTGPDGLVSTAYGGTTTGTPPVALGFDRARPGSLQGVDGLFGAIAGATGASVGGGGSPGWTDMQAVSGGLIGNPPLGSGAGGASSTPTGFAAPTGGGAGGGAGNGGNGGAGSDGHVTAFMVQI